MALYPPTYADAQADPLAMTNSLLALDATMNTFAGSGILSGMVLATSGAITAGQALVGHITNEPGSSLSSLFSGTGTFDLYCKAKPYAAVSGIGTPATYPNASGVDYIDYVVVATGISPGAGIYAMVATVVVASGVITSVNNAPTGRVQLVTPQSMSATLNRLTRLQATYPGALTAPLPVSLSFICFTAMTITALFANAATAPVGQAITMKVSKNGVEMWTTGNRPSIAAGSNAGGSSVAPDASSGSVAVCAQGDVVTVDLAQVGTTTAGATLDVVLKFQLD